MEKPDFTALLRSAGLKATPWRLALMETLWSEQKPFSVHQLEKELRGKMNEVTLYRSLETLVTAGIIRRVDLGHDHAHYELEQKHHHHLVCSDCGTIEDVEACPLPALEKKVNRSQFKSIYSHSTEFFGLCYRCS